MPNYSGAQQFPMFQRAMRNILSITQAPQALVTTTFDGTTAGAHDYSTGLIVRILIPQGFGMQLANQFLGPITVVNATQFTIPLDTTEMDPFVLPSDIPGLYYTPAQVIPVGEVNDILSQATQNVLPYP